MFTFLIVLGAMLSGQVGGAQGVYPALPITGQGAAANASSGNAAENGAPLGKSQSAPANNGANREGVAAPPGSSNRYIASPPPGFGNQPVGETQKQSPPAAYQVPPSFPANAPAAAEQAGGPKPSDLILSMLAAPRDSQLRGEPATLVQAVSGARTRSEQTQRVEAYWDLCSSVADYYLGLREQDELRQLGAGVSRPGATWQEAEKELSVRIGTSQRAARASQLRLASFMGRGGNNLPLPADAPHCGSFTTNYEQIFSHRNSPEAQELATLLPLRFTELKDAAVDVARDQDWFNGIASSRSETSDGTASLRALKLYALSRRAFVQIVRDYNRRIARYSELAMPGQISAEKLTGILIKRPGSTTATRSASPAPPPSRQSSGTESGPPPTFVENWIPASSAAGNGAAKRDDSVTPASATQSAPSKEHSLIREK